MRLPIRFFARKRRDGKSKPAPNICAHPPDPKADKKPFRLLCRIQRTQRRGAYFLCRRQRGYKARFAAPHRPQAQETRRCTMGVKTISDGKPYRVGRQKRRCSAAFRAGVMPPSARSAVLRALRHRRGETETPAIGIPSFRKVQCDIFIIAGSQSRFLCACIG